MRQRKKGLSGQRLIRPCAAHPPAAPSISVMHSQVPLRPTALPHGISSAETRRIWTAVHELARHGHGLAWIVLGDGLLNLVEHEAREKLRRFESRLALDLGRAGFPVWRVTVIHSEPRFHANIVTFDYPAIERLRTSALFGDCLQGKKAIQPVGDLAQLVSYLAWERASEATHTLGNRISARRKGSHRLESKRSGDRVKLSEDLEKQLEGIIEPWRRSYAKGLTKPAAIKPSLAKPLPVPVIEATQLVAVEEPSGQMSFAPALGEIDDLMTKADAKRRALGIRQEEASDRMHLARSTFANIIARRYRPSPWVMARAAEFLRAA